MSIQEYKKELETKTTTELKKLAKRAAQGTVITTSGMSRIAMISFIVQQANR